MNNYKKMLSYESIEPYIQYLYKNIHEYKYTTLSSSRFYEMSKNWCKNNYLSNNYSITSFGKIINIIFKDFKKRTATCILYTFEEEETEDIKVSICKALYNYNKEYYIFVNGLEEDFIID